MSRTGVRLPLAVGGFCAAVIVVMAAASTPGRAGDGEAAPMPDGGEAYTQSLDPRERDLLVTARLVAGREPVVIDHAFRNGVVWRLQLDGNAEAGLTEIAVEVDNRSGGDLDGFRLILHALPTAAEGCATALKRFGWLPVGLDVPADCVQAHACTITSPQAPLAAGESRVFRAAAFWPDGGEACAALHGRLIVEEDGATALTGFFARAPLRPAATKSAD